MADETTFTVRVSNAKLIAAFVALVSLVVGYPVANYISPTVRSDPMTGSEGRELDNRITVNELDIETIKDDDSECESRQNMVEKELKWLRELVTTYQADAKRRDEAQDWKLDECMRRSQ